MFVRGEPALLLSRNENAWRALVAQCGAGHAVVKPRNDEKGK